MRSPFVISLADSRFQKEYSRLWATCFGDNETFISLFFNTLSTLGFMVHDDHQVISQLFLIETQTNSLPSGKIYYVYACATDPKFRRQGWMKALLDHAFEFANAQGSALLLMPGDEKLAHYYQYHCGFKPFYRFSYQNVEPAPHSTLQKIESHADNVLALRNKLIDNGVLCSKGHLKLAAAIAFETQGGVAEFHKDGLHGYVIFRQSDEATLRVDEWMSEGKTTPEEVARLLAELTNAHRFMFPKTDSNGPHCYMIRSNSEIKIGYFGLPLD